MHPFHVQRVQTLQPDFYAPCFAFAQWYFWKCATDSLFTAKVLFFDEAFFARKGIFNTHNSYGWAEENPHTIRCRAAENRFSVNLQASIIRGDLIGLYLLPFRLTGHKYLVFRQQVLPQLLGDEQISASTQQCDSNMMEPLPITAEMFVTTKMSHLVSCGSHMVVPCIDLFDHPIYHVLIFISGVRWKHWFMTPLFTILRLVGWLVVGVKADCLPGDLGL